MATPGITSRAKRLAKRTAESILYRINPGYASSRARRCWNHAAIHMPREVTATFDSESWDTYWQSGPRVVESLLGLGRSAGPLGSKFAVEVGCGLGRLTRPLAGRFKAVVGVDIAIEMLKLARHRASATNIVYALVDPEGRLPLANGVADVAVAWTVFRHVARATFERYLDEIHRVLRPDGCLLFEAQIRTLGVPANPPPYDCFGEREYTRAELVKYCAAHGFAWGAERWGDSVTPGTATLITAWHRAGLT